MSAFDILFIAVFLATTVTLLSAAFLGIRGRGTDALVLLRRWCIGAAVYFGIVILSSVFWPRTVLRMGERRCFDDWCIAVENASRKTGQNGVSYEVGFRLSSRARRVTQRENNVVVYIVDQRGRRYGPTPDKSEVPMNVQLGPQESVPATRSFMVPTDAGELGLVIDHEGGFPIGWFIIGYETWFHKPTILELRTAQSASRG